MPYVVRQSLISVSIHASARDATGQRFGHGLLFSVSIHASARDATYLPLTVLPSLRFQSTRPRGTRLPAVAVFLGHGKFQSTRPRGTRPRPCSCAWPCRVSIHASARDATSRALSSKCTRSFNPRVRAGRDVKMVFDWDSGLFQSTRPRGTRPENPAAGLACHVSIHASARTRLAKHLIDRQKNA